ncbi:hypothetical protein GOP47_0006575 [Adiantum capillus-veneris]|uniref:Uncharacterized protein n=1 Tax=Adiantum capillus-veneris TaxID=13818 RepID=A0A9D4V3J3_ADICA|nr:hypothetical protein GOP47_0006575 [Adiantum capillus-veneris]
MVTTCYDVEMARNEQQENHRLANPQFKNFASTNTSALGHPIGVGNSNVGDGHIQSNSVASSLAKFADTKAESSRAVKPDLPPEKRKIRPDEYNVQKARIHANLWQQEIKKHVGESTSIDGDGESGLRGDSVWDPRKSMPEDWESFDPSEGHYHEENPAKEEAMMLEEFQKRRERNRIQIASFVKQHLYGRRRPVDGWKYIIDNFGKDEKGARGEGQTTGNNELEKLALKRESGRLSRKGSLNGRR